MKYNTLVIFDYEIDYANNLMNSINRKNTLPFVIQIFSNLESLIEFLYDHKISILLISRDVELELLNKKNIDAIYILSEGNYVQESSNYPSIYKFQSAEAIMDQIIYYAVDSDIICHPNLQKASSYKSQIISIFSIIGNCGKTSLAISLAKELSKEKKVLYINLDNFSSLFCLLEEKNPLGLSELLYFLKESNVNLILKLKSFINQSEKLDYIMPVHCCFDLYEIEGHEWELLLGKIQELNQYDFIILDIGFINSEILKLLNLSDKIYMPIKTDEIFKSKKECFNDFIYMQDMSELFQKIIQIQIPYDERLDQKAYTLEDLTHGILGEFALELTNADYGGVND